MNNKERLTQGLKRLKEQPVNSALKITSKGNNLYLLRDVDHFYCLVVPNRPLTDRETTQLKNLLFREKFLKVNFDRFFDFQEIHLIVDTISDILIKILEIPIDRQWRITNDSGMQILKSTQPSTPTSVARQMQIKKNKLFSRKLYNIFRSPILTGSIIGGIIVIVIAFKKGKSIPISVLFGFLSGSLTYLVNKYFYRQREKNN